LVRIGKVVDFKSGVASMRALTDTAIVYHDVNVTGDHESLPGRVAHRFRLAQIDREHRNILCTGAQSCHARELALAPRRQDQPALALCQSTRQCFSDSARRTCHPNRLSAEIHFAEEREIPTGFVTFLGKVFHMRNRPPEEYDLAW